jgi:hypothetical protein
VLYSLQLSEVEVLLKRTMVDWEWEFHELHFNSGKTDVYTYTFVENHVKFKSKQIGVSFENTEWIHWHENRDK